MLRALDAADRRGEAIEPGAPAGAALRAALRTAAEAPALDPASQGEVELVRRVLAGDVASLFAFGEGEPPSPPRARALLWLSQHGAGDEVRRRAKESYRVRYPDAWPMADGGLR